MVVLSRTSPYTTFQHYKTQFPSYFDSATNQYWIKEKCNRILGEQQRRFIAKNLNPFNLCPVSVTFWFPITGNLRLGVPVSNLERIGISIRQRLVPNDLIHLAIKIIQLRIPFPLTLLTIFSSLGLWINGAVNKLINNATIQLMNEQEKLLNNLEEKIEILSLKAVPDPSQLPPDVLEKVREALAEENKSRTLQALNPFSLCPIMTCYFPIYKTHTAIGIGFMDFQRLSISIRQFIEPQDVIFTTIRFIELKVPFPLAIFALVFTVGLFLNGGINEFEQGTRDEIMNEVKRIFQQYRRQ